MSHGPGVGSLWIDHWSDALAACSEIIPLSRVSLKQNCRVSVGGLKFFDISSSPGVESFRVTIFAESLFVVCVGGEGVQNIPAVIAKIESTGALILLVVVFDIESTELEERYYRVVGGDDDDDVAG